MSRNALSEAATVGLQDYEVLPNLKKLRKNVRGQVGRDSSKNLR